MISRSFHLIILRGIPRVISQAGPPYWFIDDPIRQYYFEIISYMYIFQMIRKKIYKTFSPWEFPQNGVQYLSSLFIFSYIFLIFIYFFIFLPIFPICLSCVLSKKRWEWMGKGKYSVFTGFWFFPNFWANWVALIAIFWEIQDIFNFPKIFFPLKNPTK